MNVSPITLNDALGMLPDMDAIEVIQVTDSVGLGSISAGYPRQKLIDDMTNNSEGFVAFPEDSAWFKQGYTFGFMLDDKQLRRFRIAVKTRL